MADGTAALRAAAAHWSLAGDQQLLDILQDIHQRIVSRCDETAARLEVMSRGLRDASVNLQNVNNKFLALSNTQFVERRVYEDDTDIAAPPTVAKEPPQLTDLSSDLTKLRESLQILESYHEPLHILRDSDSDSDSDGGDDRLVLKPKDLYSDRPLPYIIGSVPWKNKWHAGLIQDESDSDSSTSKVEEIEQYSDSGDEQTDRRDLDREYQPARKQSTGSSSVQSEPAAVSVSPVRPSPSLVAAELARKLGGGAKLPEREPVYSEPETVVRKLYKPQQTPSATIFPDEPPPLEDDVSSDDDIFSELHKNHQNQHSNVQDTLFDFSPKTNSLEDALFGKPPKLPDPNQNMSKQPFFEDDLMSEVMGTPEVDTKRDDNVKKPVGGISLFGTNKHAESIGAAILKRNRRKSSTSGDESNTEEVKEAKDVKEVKEVRKERDIFDDLFAKSEKSNKKSVKSDVVETKGVVKKKDAFSDIFDDIDDIFSTDIVNVQIKETKENEKPLFDDDDDLFAEIPKLPNDLAKDKVKIIESSNTFDNNKSKTEQNVVKATKDVVKEIKKESKGLFDSDSDDGLFTKVTEGNKNGKVAKNEEPVEYKISDDIFGDDNYSDDLFAKNKTVSKEKVTEPQNVSKASKTALFDSDDELFTKSSKEIKTPKEDTVSKNDSYDKEADSLFVTKIKRTDKELKDGKSINDSSDYLFESKEKSKALEVIDSINNDIFNNGDDLFKKSETLKESKIETVHDEFDNEELFSSKNVFSSSKDSSSKTENTRSVVATSQDSQDFDSPPPNDDIFNKPDTPISNLLRTTRIAADEENVQTDKPKQDIFKDSNKELFKSSSNIPKPKEAEMDNDEFLYNDITKPEILEVVSTESVKTDIFSDIFDDVPPIFEKPKEPKKSQNVNALFGDDSDDEALFFKKNDVISDEKPDFSPSEERFGIFNDEPPAIDVDFIRKPVKKDNFTENAPKSDNLSKIGDISDAFKSDEVDKTTIAKETQDTTDNTSKEPKKVGKLKPMNFNINVNTLLPGASPKKKQLEDTDGQTASNEELHKTDKIEPKMVKSISFDDPEILDNKISKDRAKIQVKRRPSTRRARKEAVRKSAIDLTDSSFDSSNDNSAKDDVKIVKTVYILNDDDIFGDSTKHNENAYGTESTKKHLNIVDSDEELFKKPVEKDETDSKLINENNNNDGSKDNSEKKPFLDSDDDLFKNRNSGLRADNDNRMNLEAKIERKSVFDSDDSDDLFKQTKTKINTTTDNAHKNTSDEDLFKNDEIKKATTNKSFLDSDDNDDLFTNKTTKVKTETIMKSNISSDEEDLFTNAPKKGIETLGKVYKSDTQVNATNIEKTRNVFDDFPPKPNPVVTEKVNIKPQEIVKETRIEKPVVKKSILDLSSDEDDLFKAKTKLTTKKDDKSLFGDDNGNDDDLFGAKIVTERKPDLPIPQSTKESKPAETVFVDPLSLFGDDE